MAFINFHDFFPAVWGYSQTILEFKKAKFSMFEGFYKMFLVKAFLLTFVVKIKVNYVRISIVAFLV